MHSHVVLYKAYGRNPQATTKIIIEAKRLIGRIPGIHALHVGKILKTSRAVTGSDYDVLMNIVFKTTADYGRYVSHKNHLAFARIVLNGYMLKGTTAENPTEEFITYILHACEPRPWIRNPAVPDSEVVWGGENGFDAT